MFRGKKTRHFASIRMKALLPVSAALLLIGAFAPSGSLLAATPDNECLTGVLDPGDGTENLLVDGNKINGKECHVGSGKYSYRNVNIINGGKLIFDEKVDSVKIDFWARSILVENTGFLLAGQQADGGGKPFGFRGGVLTIHLYGPLQKPGNAGVGGVGIICRTKTDSSTGPCGIPLAKWNDNGNTEWNDLPGGVSDFFYQYDPLPFDDGKDSTTNTVGYFGYKVLAVSYGGTLELFGDKGADYPGSSDPKSSGKSWVRLAATILGEKLSPGKGATSLTLSKAVDWKIGDHIVVTTTDYLANHSEELVICTISGTAVTFTSDLSKEPADCTNKKPVQWTHNGEQFPLGGRLPVRLKITKTAAETRAAIGLLTRSIRIVSEGDTLGTPFPPNYYFGGHTIARQGFQEFQVQGVEFRQLGQGGRLGHYPIHFHMARKTPQGNGGTYIKDSSINESMTRWITVHATQGTTLARNVGYLSIGHGFYLEDAVETDNKFYSNLGVFARAAIMNGDGSANAQNPRKVPGILASPDYTPGQVKFGSDKDTPAVFWITHGWNDFQGNMAAGAGMCGLCYWELPASISGPSRGRKWDSYASEQTSTRVGSSPLKNFDGNYCTSAMTSFQTVGYTQNCPGIGPPDSVVVPVVNPNAPKSDASAPPDCGPGTKKPICADGYYPQVDPGILNHATQCPATGPCDNTTAPLCQETNLSNCLPTLINDYTSSFNYSQYNFSAIWLRIRWHLISNSFVSDVQNAGLTFISGGDYTHSSAIKGLWELALKTVFVGETQPADKAHGFSSVLSPFNANTGLKCDNTSIGAYCISKNNSFTLGSFAAFGVSQHMFNIYDGPANEDSNAYLDIKKTNLGTNSNASVYKSLLGIPKAVQLDQKETPPIVPIGNCYIQNAAIAWKQPNGFYYPPNFRSRNLFFDKVDIRHYVIVPQFQPNQYLTNSAEAQKRYCQQNQSPGIFNGFSAIDRQTELTDDDGSLTGYAHTTSVNEDKFFTAPVEGIECQSDGATPEGGTARTSPYEYVTTVVYPDDAKNAPTPPPGGTRSCRNSPDRDPNWDAECSNETCFGVPLYRLYQTGTENKASKPAEFIRMAGMNICQRETMSVNHGLYYVDLTASSTTQNNWKNSYPPPNTGDRAPKRAVFQGGKTYDFFHVYATKDTEQTFQMYVGPGLNPATDVKLIRVNIVNAPFKISPDIGDFTTLKVQYDNTGISPTYVLTVKLDHSAFANQYASAAQSLCLPKSFCTWNATTKKCEGNDGVTGSDRDIACGYAGKDVDCPTGGCLGFSVKLPGGFTASDQTAKLGLTAKLAKCYPKNADWDVTPQAAGSPLAGACFNAPIQKDFCGGIGSN